MTPSYFSKLWARASGKPPMLNPEPSLPVALGIEDDGEEAYSGVESQEDRPFDFEQRGDKINTIIDIEPSVNVLNISNKPDEQRHLQSNDILTPVSRVESQQSFEPEEDPQEQIEAVFKTEDIAARTANDPESQSKRIIAKDPDQVTDLKPTTQGDQILEPDGPVTHTRARVITGDEIESEILPEKSLVSHEFNHTQLQEIETIQKVNTKEANYLEPEQPARLIATEDQRDAGETIVEIGSVNVEIVQEMPGTSTGSRPLSTDERAGIRRQSHAKRKKEQSSRRFTTSRHSFGLGAL